MCQKMKILLISLLGIFLLCGCSDKTLKVYNPLTEEEIISYVENKIRDDSGDQVTAKIVSKEALQVCTLWFDGPVREQTVDGGYSYDIEIINTDNEEIVAAGTYNDGYTMYSAGNRDEREASFDNDYKEQKGFYLVKKEFENALEKKFDQYQIYKDISNDYGYDIFVNSSDCDLLEELFVQLNEIVNHYRDDVYTSFSVYIYKDKKVYESTDFDRYTDGAVDYLGQSYGGRMIEQYTGKTVERIGGSEGFDSTLFESNGESAAEENDEYVDYKTFDYLVFWYHSEPNASYRNGSMQIFGVK